MFHHRGAGYAMASGEMTFALSRSCGKSLGFRVTMKSAFPSSLQRQNVSSLGSGEISNEGGARRYAPAFEKIQIFIHSFSGFGRQFENFHAWPHRLDVAFCGCFVKFYCSGEIRFCDNGNVSAVEYRWIFERLIFPLRHGEQHEAQVFAEIIRGWAH